MYFKLTSLARKSSIAGLLILSFTSVSSVSAASYSSAIEAYVAKDYKTAFLIWKPLADQGDAIAQSWVGRMYLDGQGTPKDHGLAFKWLMRAAEQGDLDAQGWLGYINEYGEGRVKNYRQAIRWYTLSAEQGNKPSQDALKELLGGKRTDWNIEDKKAMAVFASINESIKKYISAIVSFSAAGNRNLYFQVEYENLKCEITKGSKTPATRIWYFNNQAVKMNAWCRKFTNSEGHYLSLTPKSSKGFNFVLSAFRKAPSTVAIKTNTLYFKMSAKGFTKVWNSLSSEAL
jgi:hypothetical protein